MNRRFVGALLLAAGFVGAATIVTVRDPAKVYPTEQRRVYERPLYVLAKGEVVEVLKWGMPLTKIRNRKGRQGWVEPAKLDSNARPPILNLVVDTEEVVPVKKQEPVPPKAEASKPNPTAIAPVSGESQVKSAEKPVDFHKDSTHITAQSKADSTK